MPTPNDSVDGYVMTKLAACTLSWIVGLRLHWCDGMNFTKLLECLAGIGNQPLLEDFLAEYDALKLEPLFAHTHVLAPQPQIGKPLKQGLPPKIGSMQLFVKGEGSHEYHLGQLVMGTAAPPRRAAKGKAHPSPTALDGTHGYLTVPPPGAPPCDNTMFTPLPCDNPWSSCRDDLSCLLPKPNPNFPTWSDEETCQDL